MKKLNDGTILFGGQPIYSPKQGDTPGKVILALAGAIALTAAGAATAILALAM